MIVQTRVAAISVAASTLGFALLPGVAEAYVGPGAGLSAIGTVVALFGAVLLAIVGFVWYPVKRLLRRGKENAAETAEVDQKSEAPETSTEGAENPPPS